MATQLYLYTSRKKKEAVGDKDSKYVILKKETIALMVIIVINIYIYIYLYTKVKGATGHCE